MLLRNQPPRPGGPESRLPRVQTRVPERDGEAARLVTERPCPRNGPSTCGHGHRVTCRQQPSGGGATPRPPTHTTPEPALEGEQRVLRRCLGTPGAVTSRPPALQIQLSRFHEWASARLRCLRVSALGAGRGSKTTARRDLVGATVGWPRAGRVPQLAPHAAEDPGPRPGVAEHVSLCRAAPTTPTASVGAPAASGRIVKGEAQGQTQAGRGAGAVGQSGPSRPAWLPGQGRADPGLARALGDSGFLRQPGSLAGKALATVLLRLVCLL